MRLVPVSLTYITPEGSNSSDIGPPTELPRPTPSAVPEYPVPMSVTTLPAGVIRRMRLLLASAT